MIRLTSFSLSIKLLIVLIISLLSVYKMSESSEKLSSQFPKAQVRCVQMSSFAQKVKKDIVKEKKKQQKKLIAGTCEKSVD